jgi:hypothetical protein
MAGDLMFAHAEYHSTYPLPICGTIHGGAWRITEPPKSAIRKVTFARDSIEDFSTAKRHQDRKKTAPTQTAKKPPVFDKYAAVLSKRKWTSSSEIAESLGYAREAVNKFLSAHRDKLHKRQANTGKGFLVNYWKLK